MKINNFSKIRTGHTFRKGLLHVPSGNVLVVQPKNIALQGSISFDNGEPLRTDASAARPLQPKDVLVVSRGRFAAAVFDPPGSDTYIVPSSILVLSLKKSSVLPEYVACLFNSTRGQRLFQRHCEQTTIPYISAANLGQMDIPIPSIDRQRALVAYEGLVARHAWLTSRKQELLRGIMNRELGIENEGRS